MSVSVVIPCYNGERFVREAIESALRQTRPPAQVIVVDDGSSDRTVGIAMSVAGATVIAQANRGASLARNRGIAEATGEFLVFLDHDDRLLPDALEIGTKALAEHPECGFVYGFHRLIDSHGNELPEPPRRRVDDASYLRTLQGDTLVPPGCAMFRRSVIERIGGFRDGAFPTEDYDLYLRAGRAAPIHCHNRVVVDYRWHGANASGAQSARSLRAALRTLEAQREFVRGKPELERALETGRRHWGQVFGPGVAHEAVENLRRGRLRRAAGCLALALRWHPRGLVQVASHYVRRAAGRSG
jgi:glycosyltransferase involved in cell wall biosynthesis